MTECDESSKREATRETGWNECRRVCRRPRESEYGPGERGGVVYRRVARNTDVIK
jgi:hypothetical protein